uniref:C-type lectin domain-containing protein n=1 Tax=Astyanax mexicanus TaxID=7994 RepID=A0A8B9GX76_ASTMX
HLSYYFPSTSSKSKSKWFLLSFQLYTEYTVKRNNVPPRTMCNSTKVQTDNTTQYRQRIINNKTVCKFCNTCGLCGENWKRFGVKCYFFSPDFLNWTNSRDHCVKIGGHLAIITSQAEQVSEGPHWIGLNDLETEGKWMWVNKQPLTETGVTFWNKGKDGVSEPNNWKEEDPSGENCASLGNENGDFTKWFDASCSKARKYICEK